MTNKYGARRTWSGACQRWFDSNAEAERGTELFFLEQAGEISNLAYQVPFVLSGKPNASVKIIIDFKYTENGKVVYEDVKGVMTPAARVKLAWLKEKYAIEVLIVK